jgi:hypothetical protein
MTIGCELNGYPPPASYFIYSPFKTPTIPGRNNPMARMLSPVGAFILRIVLYFELFSCIRIFLVSIGDNLHE